MRHSTDSIPIQQPTLQSEPSTAAASPTLASMYVITIASLVSRLPDTEFLSKSFLLTAQKGGIKADSASILGSSVATQRTVKPSSATAVGGGDGAVLAPVAPEANQALWDEVGRTTASLHVPLYKTVLQLSVELEEADGSDTPIDVASSHAARIAAFVLMVHFLARGMFVPGIEHPSKWTAKEAWGLMLHLRPVLLASLAPELALADAAVPDAALQWILWFLAAAKQYPEPDERYVDSTSVLTLSQRLFLYIPTGLGWPTRIALRDMLAHYAGTAAIDLIQDWCGPEDRGKPSVALALARDAASVQHAPGALWSPSVRNALLPLIKTMVSDSFPPVPENGMAPDKRKERICAFVNEVQSGVGDLTEAVQWVYFYLSADTDDLAGFARAGTEVEQEVHAPLCQAVLAWSGVLAQEQEQEQQAYDRSSGSDLTQTRMALDILALALTRLGDALHDRAKMQGH